MTLTEKRNEAKRMFLSGKLQQKDIARKLGVRPNTVCEWVKRYNWRNELKNNLYVSSDPLLAYLHFVQKEHPETYQSLLRAFREFEGR